MINGCVNIFAAILPWHIPLLTFLPTYLSSHPSWNMLMPFWILTKPTLFLCWNPSKIALQDLYFPSTLVVQVSRPWKPNFIVPPLYPAAKLHHFVCITNFSVRCPSTISASEERTAFQATPTLKQCIPSMLHNYFSAIFFSPLLETGKTCLPTPPLILIPSALGEELKHARDVSRSHRKAYVRPPLSNAPSRALKERINNNK